MEEGGYIYYGSPWSFFSSTYHINNFWRGYLHIHGTIFHKYKIIEEWKTKLFPWPFIHFLHLETTNYKFRRRRWHPTPVLLPRKSHGWRSLVGCSPWGRWGSDTTERLHFHFSLSCIGEGNGNPLQCSCLENPRDGEAWWAAVYGVAQSQTQLKRLSSSSSSYKRIKSEWTLTLYIKTQNGLKT